MPQESQAIWDALIGEAEEGQDALARYWHLSSRQALMEDMARRVADERARVAARIYEEIGAGRSYAKLAVALNSSRSRAQQLIERARQ